MIWRKLRMTASQLPTLGVMTSEPPSPAAEHWPRLGFIGGGHMAQAIVGGLRHSGMPAHLMHVVEPQDDLRDRLASQWQVPSTPVPDPVLSKADMVVWAVKPQVFAQAAQACRPWVAAVSHLSIMAGVRCRTIEAATACTSVVRAMPNTPALIGQGIAALYANAQVSPAQKAWAQTVLAATGQTLWVSREDDLDAVTALSGSGPAYVFFFIEAMMKAGADMGLSPAQARQLAQQTFAGAAALAAQSPLTPAQLREQVTSKGGTTQAALSILQARGVDQAIEAAVHAARARAQELGQSK